ncbi:sulfite exporter TauE/SafE family protein [Staphylospora marina]|uniref:sulfite exporter TauE/SafE family protein n=1 Tax=Staphylospora marina TaxID=2490858 RepID=UPI000F5BE809|nr:sulfite exporter TauE/SafE family protein [Staphylospora marina]
MRRLVVLALIGFAAQLVDGALGMAYGVTSTSLLLVAGLAPAVASASVHIAEVVTTAASGVAHIRFGNVDKETVWKLTVPGAVGAFSGATFLSHLPGDLVKPYVAGFLFLLGCYVLVRFLRGNIRRSRPRGSTRKRAMAPLGLMAGFLDASGGGGWGPLATPVLLARNDLEVRKVIGSVDTSEFAIAVSASVGFFLSLGLEQVHWEWVFALMIGGVCAAPLAAWIVRKIPQQILGVLVGGIILVTNARILMEAFGWSPSARTLTYAVLVGVWIASVGYAITHHKKNAALDREIP